MPKQLSEQQIEAYRCDGGLFPVTIMSEAEAVEHRRRLEAAEAAHGNMHYRSKPYLLFSSAKEIAGNATLLDAGQASLHHGWALHASGPNPSAERRVGLTVQYLAPSARQTRSDRESATLLRGLDRYGHFQPEPDFTGDFAPEAVAFQQEAERLKHEIYDSA